MSVAGVLSGAIVALGGMAVGLFSKAIQDRMADSLQQQKIISLVRGEIRNAENHFNIVYKEVNALCEQPGVFGTALSWKKRRFGDFRFATKDFSQLWFVDEETVSQFLQLSLFVRNNDLEIDDIICRVEATSAEAREGLTDALQRMRKRARSAGCVARNLLEQPVLSPRVGVSFVRRRRLQRTLAK